MQMKTPEFTESLRNTRDTGHQFTPDELNKCGETGECCLCGLCCIYYQIPTI